MDTLYIFMQRNPAFGGSNVIINSQIETLLDAEKKVITISELPHPITKVPNYLIYNDLDAINSLFSRLELSYNKIIVILHTTWKTTHFDHMLLAKKHGYTTIAEMHQVYFYDKMNKLLSPYITGEASSQFHKYYPDNLDYMMVLNPYDKYYYNKMGVKNINTIFNIEQEVISTYDYLECEFSHYYPYFVSLTRWDPEKLNDITIEVFKRFNKNHNNEFHLLLAGEGNENEFKRLQKLSGNDENIVFLNKVSGIRKQVLISDAAALLSMSLSENQPIVYVEALRNQTNVIAMDNPISPYNDLNRVLKLKPDKPSMDDLVDQFEYAYSHLYDYDIYPRDENYKENTLKYFEYLNDGMTKFDEIPSGITDFDEVENTIQNYYSNIIKIRNNL